MFINFRFWVVFDEEDCSVMKNRSKYTVSAYTVSALKIFNGTVVGRSVVDCGGGRSRGIIAALAASVGKFKGLVVPVGLHQRGWHSPIKLACRGAST